MFDFIEKEVIITGGGSGIGKAAALLFGEKNASVHIVDINEEVGRTTAEEIIAKGGKAKFHICDISQQEKVKETFSGIEKIDVLVNSAGVSHIGKADTTSEEDFDRIYRVNIKGVYNCLHVALQKNADS